MPSDAAPHPPNPAGAPEAEEPSWIAQERVGDGAPPALYWAWIAVAATAVLVAGLVVGRSAATPLPAESQAALSASLYGSLASSLGVDALRIASAVAMAVGVLASAEAARRLLHSPLAGALVPALLLLDPATWIMGGTALPNAWVFGGAAAGLAVATTAWPAAPWLAALPLALAAATDAGALWFCAAVAAVLALRGHIYSSGRHVAVALGGALGVPAAAALASWAIAAARDGPPLCALPWHDRMLLLRVLDIGDGSVLAHNPVVWYGGAAAALLLGLAALGRVAAGFRMTRQPGRTMFRLPGRLARDHGRALWLLLLAAAAVAPGALLPVAATALAAGIGRLGKDATGFAIPLHLAITAFSAVYFIRLWPFVMGSGGDIAEALLPWTSAVPCAA